MGLFGRRDEVFPAEAEFPQEFSRMMDRGSFRCRDISDSERILGYRYNYFTYRDMADELRGLPIWVYQEIIRGSEPGNPQGSYDDAA